MSKELRKLLDTPDKRVKEAKNALANLFRRISADLGVGSIKWDQKVMRYLNSPLSRTPKNAKDIGQDKNNLNRALAKDQLTYNNFIKFLMILGPKRIKITISMEWKNEETTVHEVAIDNVMAELDNDEDDRPVPRETDKEPE